MITSPSHEHGEVSRRRGGRFEEAFSSRKVATSIRPHSLDAVPVRDRSPLDKFGLDDGQPIGALEMDMVVINEALEIDGLADVKHGLYLCRGYWNILHKREMATIRNCRIVQLVG